MLWSLMENSQYYDILQSVPKMAVLFQSKPGFTDVETISFLTSAREIFPSFQHRYGLSYKDGMMPHTGFSISTVVWETSIRIPDQNGIWM
jgi:hypothetical protein